MDASDPHLRVSLRDVAKRLGLNVSTVSRAMRDNPRVTEALRRQIQETAQEMGYRPDAMLSSLAHYRKSKAETPVTASIAWLNAWAEPSNLRKFREFDAYWRGAVASAEKLGYHLEEFVLGKDLTLDRLKNILLARNIQGLLIPPHGGSSRSRIDWTDLDLSHFSAVRFGHTVWNVPLNSVSSDRNEGGMLAFDEMRKRGYQRIGICLNPHHQNLFGAGFLWAQDLALPERERVPPLFHGDQHVDCKALAKWVKKHRLEGIFTDTGVVLDALKQIGYRVPEDIGVATTSIQDTPINAGIDQKPEEIGRVAVLVVISLINDNAHGIPADRREILISPRWVDGSSLPLRS